jgi:hypothetical protein
MTDQLPMKTYKTFLRAVLMLATIFFLLFGALSSYQHWAGSKTLLWIGLLLFMIMVGDHYRSKRIGEKQSQKDQ